MLAEALRESRAVGLLGARQVGKSTLAQQIGGAEHPARVVSLDADATASSARSDPHLMPTPAGLLAGVVLYTGAEALPFGDRLAAVPLSALWQ